MEACRVLANPKVSLMVAELQMEAQERTLVTVESITQELDEARSLALEEKQAAAATSAIMGKAKIHGLLIDKGEVKHDVSDPMKAFLAQVASGGNRLVKDDSAD